ncbi:MAG: GAF domain-containing protein [Chloroflexi bacterium]|nr:GAF domain-containing protein [Chloroflexota bacterium]
MHDIVYRTDYHGILTDISPSSERRFGYRREEILGRNVEEFYWDPQNYAALVADMERDGAVNDFEIVLKHRDGRPLPNSVTARAIFDAQGQPIATEGVLRDITERKQAETALAERAKLAAFSAEVGLLLNNEMPLAECLRQCAESIVRHLDAAFARIWLLDITGNVLILRASAGMYTNLHGVHSRKPLNGDSNIARIARERQPHLTNTTLDDPGIVDKDWIKQEGMASFAGHPLIIEDRVVGVMAMFARQPLPDSVVRALETVANAIALGVERRKTVTALQQQLRFANALNETAEIIITQDDPGVILERTVQTIGETLGVDRSLIYDISFGKYQAIGLCEWLNSMHTDIEPTKATYPLGIFIGGATEMRRTRHWLVTHADNVNPHFIEDGSGEILHRQMKIQSLLWYPFAFYNQGYYVIVLNQIYSRREWAEEEIVFLDSISRQVSIELVKIRLLEERQRHERFITNLNDITRATNVLDFHEMLQILADRMGELLDADGCYITQWDEARQQTIPAAAYGSFRETYPTLRIGPGEVTMTESVLRAGHALVVEDMLNTPYTSPRIAANFPTRSMLGLPLISNGEKLGAALIGFNQSHQFTADEIARGEQAAGQIALAMHKARLFDETRRRATRMTAMHEIDRLITSNTDLRLTLSLFLEQTTARLGVDAADILFYSPPLLTLDYALGRGFRAVVPHFHLRLNEGYAGRAALERQMLYIADLRQHPDDFLRFSSFTAEDFVAYYAIPLTVKGQLVGVLELFHRALLSNDVEWLDFLEALAEQAAIAVDNARLFSNLKQASNELQLAYDTTIEGWSRAVDLRDKETEGHTLRVTELAERFAKAIGLSDAELVHIRRGALLHDIGKLGVPDNILHKPAELSPEEWAVMRQHPQYAYNMLAPISYLRPALDIPYCHHEKWDGGGYPRALKRQTIPLAARLFAVVDVWDALSSDRPYRQRWPELEVLEYIKQQSGKHFDPSVVETFLKLIDKG